MPRRSLQTVTGVVVAVLAAVVVAGCGNNDPQGSAGGAGGSDSEAKSRLVVAVVNTPPTLDTDFFAGTPQSWEIADNLYDTLHYYKTDDAATERSFTEFEPRLAESIEQGDDGVWTVKLRQGVKNQLDHEMTADDWIWSWERATAVNGVGAFLGAQIGITDMKQVKKVDDYTVELHPKGPSPILPHILTTVYHPVYDSQEVKKHATDADPWARDWLATNAAGYGPYYVESLKAGSQMVLRANPNYWDGKPAIDTVIYKAVPESSNRLALVRSGDVDIALGLSSQQLKSIEDGGDKSLEIYTAPSNNEIALTMNAKKKPLDDPQVRQAILYALPYDQVLNDVFNGWAKPLKSWIPSMFEGYTDEYFPYTTDPAKAKQLLDQSGASLPIKLTAVYGPFHPEAEALMVAVRTALAEVGVDLTLEPVTTAKFGKLALDRSADMMLTVSLQSHALDAGFGIGQFADCDPAYGFLNWSNYCNEEANALFKQARSEADPEKRLEEIREMQRVFSEDPPWAVLGTFPFAIVHRSNVSGILWAPDDGLKFAEITKE